MQQPAELAPGVRPQRT